MAFGEIEPTGTIFSAWHDKTDQFKYKTPLDTTHLDDGQLRVLRHGGVKVVCRIPTESFIEQVTERLVVERT